jgi:hypothetical protein
MTTYTTTAIATNSVDNTLTVASISNMIPGLPITFTGTTFGGITTSGTYYIGTIIYGYPTSKITLTSLPGGAVFALTTDTGSMTANWTDGGQQILVTTPPGENLNTAFTKINTNFDQIWASGPVGSNIKISNNTIYTLDTNGDLVLNPNGVGNIVANAHIVPDQYGIRNLGSADLPWGEFYALYASFSNISLSTLTLPVGNFHLLGGNANNVLQTNGDGQLSWVQPLALAGGDVANSVQYNDNGTLNGNASFTFDPTSNTVNLQNLVTTGTADLNTVGNITITGGRPGYVLQTNGAGRLSWVAPLGNTQTIQDQQIQGDGNTVYSLQFPAFTNTVLVSINGVVQRPTISYVVDNETITFAEPLINDDVADIRFLVGGQSGNGQPGGANGSIQFHSGDGFGGTANLSYDDTTGNLFSTNAVVSGNITASYYYGDGSHLTGITATANTGTITFANNVIGTSDTGNGININSAQNNYITLATGGNSSTAQLLWATNIGAVSPAQLNNGVINGNTWGTQIAAGNTGLVVASNSVSGLKTWTFTTAGNLTGAGGVIAGNINSTGPISAVGTITTAANVSAVGNISASYFTGNGRFLTGILTTYNDSNVYSLLNGSAANIIPLASAAYSLGNSTRPWRDLWVSNSSIYMNNVPIRLTASNVLTVAGNPVVTVTGGNATVGSFSFVGNSLQNANVAGINNGNLSLSPTAGLGWPRNADSANVAVYNWYGCVSVQAGTDTSHVKYWTFDPTGNITLPEDAVLGNPYQDQPNVAGLRAGTGGYAVLASQNLQQYVQVDDNAVYVGTGYPSSNFAWTFDKLGNLTLPNVVGASINYANGRPYVAGSTYSNANVVSLLQNFGSNTISTTGNISAGNVNVTGNVAAEYFKGDGSRLTGITATANTGNISFTNSTIVGPSFGISPSANSSVYIQPTVDSNHVFQFTRAGQIHSPVVPLASLTPVAGSRAFVNDANLAPAGNFGQQVTGGYSNATPVWSDGINWYIG